MIAKGSSGLKAYVGSTSVAKMYKGDVLVYNGSTEDNTDYFALTASAASTVSRDGTYASSLQYSLDKASWNTFDTSTTISLGSGDTVYFRGNNTRLGSSTSDYTRFVMTGALSASGNIMTLLYGKNVSGQLTIPNAYCFAYLLYGCTALTSAADLSLPATTLATYCYYKMFQGCTGLIDSPYLPATTLPQRCYEGLFQGCSSLEYVKMMCLTKASYSLRTWMYQVKELASSIFVKHIDATWTDSGQNGVPSKWTIIYYNPTTDKYYLSDKTTECDDHGNVV